MIADLARRLHGRLAGRLRRRHVGGLKICFLPNADMFFLVDSKFALSKLGLAAAIPRGPFSSIYIRDDDVNTPSFYVGYLESCCLLVRVMLDVRRDADFKLDTTTRCFEYCDPEFPDCLYDVVLCWLEDTWRVCDAS